jgi:GntR family transcriptional repressor for pyruvate dehydrogenase complex
MPSEAEKPAELFQSLQLRRERLNEQIAASIQEMIAVNRLKPGVQLPSERELARLMGVNRSTVREALRILEHRGLVTMRMGSGTYIADVPADTVSESIERYIVFGQSSHEELIKLREMLEPEIAATAAEQATDDDLMRLKELAAQIEVVFSAGAVADYARLDTDFHQALAEATHNALVIAIITGLRKVMQGWVLAQSATHRIEEGAHSHGRVAESVAARDPAAARQSMRYHNQIMRTTMTADVELAGKQLSERLALGRS